MRHAASAFCGRSVGMSVAKQHDVPAAKLHQFVHDSFRAHVLNDAFPCVAAKSAVRNGQYTLCCYDDLTSPSAASRVGDDLHRFIEHRSTKGFSSFIASFENPRTLDEVTFEKSLWSLLQSLDDLDAGSHPWDPAVACDPTDADFAFSFGGAAFFVVGLHAASARFARRFAFPTLVFNAHDQFETLRWERRYDRMQEVIRARDVALQGTPNAMLAPFGARSEANQYAGRVTEASWQCPFRHGRNR